jgi:NADPH:quinone reductase-like Zn-dependent oxidoreductase
MADQNYDIVVERKDLSKAVVESAPSPELITGQIRVRIDLYALTANNVTYGVAGETMKYWDFYPARTGMGRIPVWGFANVTESKHDGVPIGERLYGYWPMSRETVLTIGKVSPQGLTEMSPNRAALAGVYNSYTRVAADPNITPATEPYVALIRPLFTTSFLIDDFLGDNNFFGADTVLITSASSKTALGLAYCLAQRKGRKTIGVTSQANKAFVESVGLYTDVITYDQIRALKAPGGAVMVDMAGGATTLTAIHNALCDDLKYSCRVGLTQWNDLSPVKGLPGPKPIFFFAPDRIKIRMQDWGPADFIARTSKMSTGFVTNAGRWMKIESQSGPDAIIATFKKLLQGDTRPEAGIICIP